jgi:zinc-binding alcohol dehydrogenase/oxidoreductase
VKGGIDDMKAIILREIGGPEKLQLETVPDPYPGQGEAVVRLKAAALNHRDVWIRRGLYAGIRLPVILGSDGAGMVEQVGSDVEKKWLNLPVIINPGLFWGENPHVQGPRFNILGLPWDGTYAEKVKVPVVNLHPKPGLLSWEEAAAVPLASLTAYRALVTRAVLQAGETLLITGIGGGVSTFALQIARKIGARIIVTSSCDKKLARAKSLGAEAGVNYRDADWEQKVLELTDGRGPEVVLDSVGGETFPKCLQIARPGGRIVTYGSTQGPAKELLIRQIFWKQLTILGSTMGTTREFEEMMKWYEKDELRPVIDQIFPLEAATEAHRRMDNAEQFGKIILRID